jgi:sugar phosphate permease
MLGPHLSFNPFRLSVFYSLVNSYSVDYVTRQKLNLKKKNKQNNGRPGTGNSVKEEE